MKKNFFALSLMVVSLFFGTPLAAFSTALEIQQETVNLLKPKLNSDRIVFFFGNYGVDPLDIDSPVFPLSRISNLYSAHEGKKIMRTLAVVDYFQPISSELCDVHREIGEGKSIGIALREHGWNILKKPVYFGVTVLSPALMKWMDEQMVNQGALHVYRLEVSKNDLPGSIPYCTIIEVHSPQYLSKGWLQALYDDQFMEYSVLSNDVEGLLNRLSILVQDFPTP